MPITSEEAAALAAAIGAARGLRPGQLPEGGQFAEGLNGIEECAGFIATREQTKTPMPLVKYVPLPVIEPGGRP
ncbi:MAG: hypothetical protein AB7V42_00495 [Thermoleophilia bacterium]